MRSRRSATHRPGEQPLSSHGKAHRASRLAPTLASGASASGLPTGRWSKGDGVEFELNGEDRASLHLTGVYFRGAKIGDGGSVDGLQQIGNQLNFVLHWPTLNNGWGQWGASPISWTVGTTELVEHKAGAGTVWRLNGAVDPHHPDPSPPAHPGEPPQLSHDRAYGGYGARDLPAYPDNFGWDPDDSSYAAGWDGARINVMVSNAWYYPSVCNEVGRTNGAWGEMLWSDKGLDFQNWKTHYPTPENNFQPSTEPESGRVNIFVLQEWQFHPWDNFFTGAYCQGNRTVQKYPGMKAASFLFEWFDAGRGVVIGWEKHEFELASDADGANYGSVANGSDGGANGRWGPRWYGWVRLRHKKSGKYMYVGDYHGCIGDCIYHGSGWRGIRDGNNLMGGNVQPPEKYGTPQSIRVHDFMRRTIHKGDLVIAGMDTNDGSATFQHGLRQSFAYVGSQVKWDLTDAGPQMISQHAAFPTLDQCYMNRNIEQHAVVKRTTFLKDGHAVHPGDHDQYKITIQMQ